MSVEVLAEQRMPASFNAELVNKYSKYIKSVGKRVVEVEFCWFQARPRQNLRLRMTEQQFVEGQKHICLQKLLTMKFERFTDLVAPMFANNAAEISETVLRSTFDGLFDQHCHGIIAEAEFASLVTLLKGFSISGKSLTSDSAGHMFTDRSNHISFKEFCGFVKCGYVRELLMGDREFRFEES